MSVWNKFYNKNTWENLQKDKDYSKWTFEGKKNSSPFGDLPTNEEMTEAILDRVDDEGFFRDCLEWLRKIAPRKIRMFLKRLSPSPNHRRVTYDDLCDAVHQMGFRASEILERRMILGPTNKSVQEYFDDFPFGEQNDR
jgi:hypothetical protein